MRIEEAREVVRPRVLRAASTPLSLTELEHWHDEYSVMDEDDTLHNDFDAETRWAYLILTRWSLHELHDLGVTRRWPPELIEALELLHSRVEWKRDTEYEIRSGGATSFAIVDEPEHVGDPLGERWGRSDEDGVGNVTYAVTDRPNHTLTRVQGGKPVYERNERPLSTDDESEIRRLLEADAVTGGFTLADYVASPGRGRASAGVGARLDALSRSTRRLLDLGYDRATIGAVVGRDKRRLSELENRTHC